MAMARQSLPAMNIQAFKVTKHGVRLAVSAGVLAALCGVFAFVSLVLRDHGRPHVMVNEQSAPSLTLARSNAKPAVPSPAAAADKPANPQPHETSPVSKTDNAGKHDIRVSKSAGLASADSVKLKLLRTDPANGLYDISVVAGRRSFTQRQLKLNQPLWISVNRGTAMQMVVTSIENDAVAGYWTESKQAPRFSRRIRSKHR
jgi:hypothetical protein